MTYTTRHDDAVSACYVSPSEYLYWLTYLADMVWTSGYARAEAVTARLIGGEVAA